MPISQSRAGSTARNAADTKLRAWLQWLFNLAYDASPVLLALAAGGIAAYAFTVAFEEGARAIIFFAVPAMWGAFILAVHDGRPKAMIELSAPVAYSLAVVAGLVLASVLFLDTPVSIANLALGMMEAFFLLMRLSNQKTAYSRFIPPEAEVPVRAFLIMVTVTCIVIAVVL